MYNKTHDAYRYNPLTESNTKQISFLFGRLLHFIVEADRCRSENLYQEFAFSNQRAISLIHGLSSFFESELQGVNLVKWNQFFILILQNLNIHTIEPNPVTFGRICTTVREMEMLWKTAGVKNQNITIPSLNTTQSDLLHKSEINVENLTDPITNTDAQITHMLENLDISI